MEHSKSFVFVNYIKMFSYLGKIFSKTILKLYLHDTTFLLLLYSFISLIEPC